MNDEHKLPGLHSLDLPDVGHRFLQRVYEHVVDAGEMKFRGSAFVALRTAPTLLAMVHSTPHRLGVIIESFDDMFLMPVNSFVIDEVGHVWEKMNQHDDPAVRGWACISGYVPRSETGHPIMIPETAEQLSDQVGPLNFGFCLSVDTEFGAPMRFDV